MSKKILIIAPAWVGDMVMAQSLFTLLKQTRPNCIIDIVAPSSTLVLAKRMPEINQTFLLDVKHGGLQWRARYQLGKQLRAESYDQVIVLPNSWKSALIALFSQAPTRTGWLGEWRYGLLNDTRRLNKQRYPLMIERFCALAFASNAILPSPLPYPHLQVDLANQVALKDKFSLTQQKAIALCPGAEYGPSKRWLPRYFAEIAKAYRAKGYDIWILGGPKDQVIAREIQVACNQICLDFTGQTSLLDAIDLLQLASIVVTNDSGLMHIAASVQVPLLALYGSTSPKFTPPLSDQVKIIFADVDLPCRPCFQRTCRFGHYHCLTQLLPKQVLEAMEALL